MDALSPNEIASLRALIDKQKIYETSNRYHRGMDRWDMELAKSAYWDDATDNHGPFIGSSHELCEFARARKDKFRLQSHHATNTQIELMGDEAKVEIYFIVLLALKEPDLNCFVGGRYKDLYQKRGDEWKILRRFVVWDWMQPAPNTPDWDVLGIKPDKSNSGTSYPDDAIYGTW